jgi:hypothetical protein
MISDIIYCGQCLKEGVSLESSGVHQGSTVHVVSKPVQNQSSPEKGKCIGTLNKYVINKSNITVRDN